MTTTILTILIGYVMPTVYMYFWTRSAHREGGVFEGVDTTLTDVFLTLMPVLNIIASFQVCALSINGKEGFEITANKFFGVKKSDV